MLVQVALHLRQVSLVAHIPQPHCPTTLSQTALIGELELVDMHSVITITNSMVVTVLFEQEMPQVRLKLSRVPA